MRLDHRISELHFEYPSDCLLIPAHWSWMCAVRAGRTDNTSIPLDSINYYIFVYNVESRIWNRLSTLKEYIMQQRSSSGKHQTHISFHLSNQEIYQVY